MVLTTYIATITSATIGLLIGMAIAALGLIRRKRSLDDREAAIAATEIGRYRGGAPRLAAVGSSIVKPREENPRQPAADESPADPVPVYRFRSAEALAAGYAVMTRALSSVRASMNATSEFEALARVPRRERDHAGDEPASILLARLRAEHMARADESRRILQDAVAATVVERLIELEVSR
jgi:hypothetical protein